jgi:hypothetical protein
VLLKAAEFISLERLCCPFLGFALEVEPDATEAAADLLLQQCSLWLRFWPHSGHGTPT